MPRPPKNARTSASAPAAAGELTPSTLPGVYELASLAAALMPSEQRSPAEAVRLAIKLWGAALGLLTERAVEEARLEHTVDRTAGAARRNEWQLRHLGLADSVARDTVESRKWEQKAARVFKNLPRPAPFDTVMRLIREAPVMDGREAHRHREFAAVWVTATKRTTFARIESSWETRKPAAWDPSLSKNLPIGTPVEKQTQQRDLDTALRKREAGKQADLTTAEKEIETTSAAFRSEHWDQPRATAALRLWKEHTATAQRRAAGRKPKKR
jgi:hypothetical protein